MKERVLKTYKRRKQSLSEEKHDIRRGRNEKQILIPVCHLASFCRISTRRIFPLMVLGSSSTNSMTRGYL